MTRRFAAAALAVVALNLIVTGYGAVAAGQKARAACVQDHGTVRSHECVKHGEVLFGVPL